MATEPASSANLYLLVVFCRFFNGLFPAESVINSGTTRIKSAQVVDSSPEHLTAWRSPIWSWINTHHGRLIVLKPDYQASPELSSPVDFGPSQRKTAGVAYELMQPTSALASRKRVKTPIVFLLGERIIGPQNNIGF
jgi:hypothetical protein